MLNIKDMTSPQNTGLDNFSWPATDVDFFKELEKGEAEVGKEVEKEVLENSQQVIKDEKGKGKGKESGKESEVPKQEDYFAKLKEEEVVIEEEESGKKGKREGVAEPAVAEGARQGITNEDQATLQYLLNKGLLDIEEELNFEELEPEEVKEIIQQGLEAKREQDIEERISSLPEEVKNLVKYSLEGGDYRKYVSAIAANADGRINEKIDLTNESNQELVVAEMLRRKGNDDEDIELQIEVLKDKGTLERYAKSKFEEWKRDKAEEQAKLIAQQEEQKRAQMQASKEAKMSVKNYLNSVQEIGSVPIPNNIKNTLPSYIHDRTVKLKDGSAISEFQRDLYYGLLQSKEGVLQMAVLLKNLNKERTALDLGFVERNGGDKNAKQVRANIRRIDNTPPSRSKTPVERAKTLIEMLKTG